MDFAVFSNGNWWRNLIIFHLRKYVTVWESSWRNEPILWKNYEYQFPRLSLGFVTFYHAMGNWWGNPSTFRMMKYTTGWESNWKKPHTMEKVWELISQAMLIWLFLVNFPMIMEKKRPFYGKSMSTCFPGPPRKMDFVGFFRAMENWWENSWISHMLKYTIEWESDGEITHMLWKKYDYQFLRFSPYNGFCCIFPCYSHDYDSP